MTSTSPLRILFSSGPLYGHINTLLPLAVAARRAGHEVAVATGPDLVAHVERRGLTAWPVGPTHAEAGGSAAAAFVGYFATTAAKRAVDLVPRAVSWRPDVVVHEETELVGPVVAAATGARHVVHGLGLMPPLRIWEAFRPSIDELHRHWDVPGGAEAGRDATYLEICPPSLRPEGERIWARALPLRPAAGEPGPGDRLPAAMAALPYARTVHLTLGTVFHEAAGVLEAAIDGLRKLPVNLVVTTGPGSDPTRFGPQPAHVLLAPYLPHSLLLPRCDLVVGQGGAGIMFGALSHGLPQLVLPQGAEQFTNAEACAAAGAALTLTPEKVSAAAVAEAAARLLTEPGFATAAGAVRAEIEAMPDAAEVLGAVTASTPC